MNPTQLELQGIGRLQQQLLPHAVPQFSGWEMSLHYEVGKSSGGDYYDVLPMDADHVGIVIADVSGHGPAAAVLTAMIRMLLHSCPITSGQRRDPFCSVENSCPKSPHVILPHLNQTLVENSLEKQFVTMVFGVVNLSTGEIQFSIAGHMPPCWWRGSSGTLEAFPDIGGLPLGIDTAACYETATLQLSPGDLVVFCTDGLTEARDVAGRMYGSGRLYASIRAAGYESADSVKSSVIRRLQGFLNGGHLDDDLTLLILKRAFNRERCPSEQFIG
jgi:sigma-B regulation protein RsbU (phosphoserine phosphatase)